MGHGEPTQYASRDAYAGAFIDFDAMDVAAWRGHQAGNNAPITFPVCAKLRTPAAYEDQTVCPERLRPGARAHGKGGQSAYKVLPIGCSISRTTLVHREGIIERYGFRLYVSMNGGIVEDGRLICGEEIEPLTR